MAIINPPPSKVEKFNHIWKNWLNNLWIYAVFVYDTLTSHTSDTNWNAHGNEAVGAADSELSITAGSFHIDGATGNTPSSLTDPDTHFCWIPAKQALRAGSITSTQWDTIGSASVAIGSNATATTPGAIAIGNSATATGFVSSLALGIAASATGLGTVAIGTASTAGGTQSVAVGNSCAATAGGASSIGSGCQTLGSSSVAIGASCNTTVNGSASAAIGLQASTDADSSCAMGLYTKVSAAKSYCIGIGIGPGVKLDCNVAKSFWIGVDSDEPTFIMRNNAGGVGTYANIGIVEKNPKSTFEVAGSTGYKYTNLSTSVDTSKTIGATDNELVFFIDPDTADFVLTLPDAATVDRRMYYIRNVTYGAAESTFDVLITPAGTDTIDATSFRTTAPSTTAHALDRGLSAQIVADGTNGVWRLI